MSSSDGFNLQEEVVRLYRIFVDHPTSWDRRISADEMQRLEKMLLEVRDSPPHANDWVFGKLLLAYLESIEATTERTKQVLSVIIYKAADLDSNYKSSSLLVRLWQSVLKTEFVLDYLKAAFRPGQRALYIKFLNNCLQNMEREKGKHLLVALMNLHSVSEVINTLIEDASASTVVHEILATLFTQLINEPARPASKAVVRIILEKCHWSISESIREMLDCCLREPQIDFNYFKPQHVYTVIFELLHVKKDLVVGLINNTELCLERERKDRLEGLEFFCNLFGATDLPQLPNPSEFYSRLWQEFLLQNISIGVRNELKVLAMNTSKILKQPSSHDDWCKLLFYLLEHVLPTDCELIFISEITNSMQDATSWSVKDGPQSLLCLVEMFLTPGSPYELVGKARSLLLTNLGEIYEKAARIGASDMTLSSVREFCSRLVSCFLRICSGLSPTMARWNELRKYFVQYLVPSRANDELRMKMLLYLWVNVDPKWSSVLHELFSKTAWARMKLIKILQVLENESTFQKYKSHLPRLCRELTLVVTAEEVLGTFVLRKLFPKLRSCPKLRRNLTILCGISSSCANKQALRHEVGNQLKEEDGDPQPAVEAFLDLVCEVTFDEKSLECLGQLVNSCVAGNEVSTSLGMHRLHVARSALHLLHGVLGMLFSPSDDILDLILEWSRPIYGSLSMLALRCLTRVMLRHRLDASSTSGRSKKDEVLELLGEIIANEPGGHVKVAIKCFALHSESHERDSNLMKVLKMINENLTDPEDVENFGRGLSAIGHVAVICPSSLKASVDQICRTILIQDVISRCRNEEDIRSESTCHSDNSWGDWQEVPHLAVQVQAVQSIGRCVRFCGSFSTAEMALKRLVELTSTRGREFQNWREVDVARLRCEAAVAILNIFESEQLQMLVSKSVLVALSKLMLDPRVEVRHRFAEKLCQGLSPHKVRKAYGIGQSRGFLPPCFLGLLALMGSNLWRSDVASKLKAEQMLKEVCASRILFLSNQSFFEKVYLDGLYAKKPVLVLENMLAAAVPILVENYLPDLQYYEEDAERISNVLQCLKFVCSMMNHAETYVGQVSRQYMESLVEGAKERLTPAMDSQKQQMYAVIFQLLTVAVKYYKPREKSPLKPPLVLPPPFFSNDVQDSYVEEHDVLSHDILKLVEKTVYSRASEDKEQFDLSIQDTLPPMDSDLSHSELSF